MRTAERLKGLKRWATKELCEGRKMKTPGKNMNITEIAYKEPRCYLGWTPARMDATGQLKEDPYAVCPGILIMPSQAYAKYTEEKRFDRYSNIHRPQEMGQHLAVNILFSVYEPGVRLPGFVESAKENGKGLDMSLIMEGTEQGLFTLLDWMDDCKQGLIRDKMIEGTDLIVEEDTITYSLYTDQNYVVDRRPIYYGFVSVSFMSNANDGINTDINNLLS